MTKLLLFKKQLLLLLFSYSSFCFAQVNQEWVAFYNGPGNNFDGAASLAIDMSGNVYVTGESIGERARDYATIKYNAAGVQQWVARYNGDETGFSEDRAHAIAVDGQGNVYVTGGSERGTRILSDFATVKYNSDGVMQWVARYNGPADGFDEGRSVEVDEEGNVYVTGVSADLGNTFLFTTIKYNANGIQQWVATFGGPGTTNTGNVLALDEAGNVYVTGGGLVPGELEGSDYITIKYDNDGNEIWVKNYDGPAAGNSFDVAQALALDESGNVYVTGLSAAINLASDYATIKYDTDGNEQWVARYNGPGNSFDQAFSVAVDTKHNVYVTGASRAETGEENDDYATIRYDANGNEVWVSRYNGPADSTDRADGLALDGQGNVYVTGGSYGIGTLLDFATIKYDTAGVEQWVARFNGPDNRDDCTGNSINQFTSHPIAVDALGSVYITGFSNFDYATIKYSQPLAICGKNNDKVLICHKGKTLCVGKGALRAHIAHGDNLGECQGDDVAARKSTELPALTRELPAGFRLFNAPNPVTSITGIYYELPVEGYVSLQVYDMLGRQITTLVNGSRKAGYHRIDLDASTLLNGVYSYRIIVKTQTKVWTQTKKLSVIK